MVAFWDGKSKGTKNSIDLAKKQLKNVIMVIVNDDGEVMLNHNDSYIGDFF